MTNSKKHPAKNKIAPEDQAPPGVINYWPCSECVFDRGSKECKEVRGEDGLDYTDENGCGVKEQP